MFELGLKVYVARRSYGWLFLFLLTIFLLFIGFFTLQLYMAIGDTILLIPSLLILGVALFQIIVLANLPYMRYELNDEKLVIKCGFILKYVIPLSSIKRVVKRDLEISLWSSFRLPGLALFRVPYADVGVVKMCATSMSRGIILIETDRGLYGITPDNEEQFIADLHSRIRGKLL